MSKNRRQKIIELISSNIIETQEDLQNMLKASGFNVTQSTVSRDIKQLNLYKANDANGHYCYTLNAKEVNFNNLERFKDTFKNSVIKIDYAMNNVVVKCYTGMAQAACVAIDALFSNVIVGSLAGDDTVFIITKNETKAASLVEELNKIL